MSTDFLEYHFLHRLSGLLSSQNLVEDPLAMNVQFPQEPYNFLMGYFDQWKSLQMGLYSVCISI